jgi:GNAT superfamily N-acetyltransferase
VPDVRIRPARHDDIEQLVELRSDFTFEGRADVADVRAGYEDECRAFLHDAIGGGNWHVWIAEADRQIVSHAFVALVEKVPRPIREKTRIAYLTNVYTRPAFRGQGIGAEIIRHVQAAARDADVELIIVWPSEESVDFYERSGFRRPDEPLIWLAPE